MSIEENTPAWAKQLIEDVSTIKEDTALIPQILEIVQANGQGIEVLATRMDKLERMVPI